MKIKEKLILLKDSTIDTILRFLDPPKESNGHVEVSILSPEERIEAFKKFSEGNDDLFNLLTTAYDHGIESIFCCSGHNVENRGYVLFKVTEDNLKLLQQLGKVLSHEGVSTNFQNHHQNGFQVGFHSCKTKDSSWFHTAAETIKYPPEQEIIPEIYYHEDVTNSYVPLSQKLKDHIIPILKKMHTNYLIQNTEESSKQHSETLSERLKRQFPDVASSDPKIKDKDFIENTASKGIETDIQK